MTKENSVTIGSPQDHQSPVAVHFDMGNVVCLCGSTRFREHFMELAAHLTMQGAVVLMPNVFGRHGDVPDDGRVLIGDEEKAALDVLHYQKVAMARVVIAVNVGGYVGDSTRRELAFAQAIGRDVRPAYLKRETSRPPLTGATPRIEVQWLPNARVWDTNWTARTWKDPSWL